MLYTETHPHPELAAYIDAYWSVKGAVDASVINKILPDGCVDIIYNPGEDGAGMKSGKAYLIGAMTRPIETAVTPGTNLQGVRFKPGAFAAFFTFSSLHEITDSVVEWEKELPLANLNKFFLDKLSKPKHRLFPLLEDIQTCHGQVRVEELAKKHFITVRQLERNFSYYIGISPKEFINQVRFRHALRRVRSKRPGECLSEIALQCGYYDHSHLVLEIKKYTGEVPKQV